MDERRLDALEKVLMGCARGARSAPGLPAGFSARVMRSVRAGASEPGLRQTLSRVWPRFALAGGLAAALCGCLALACEGRLLGSLSELAFFGRGALTLAGIMPY